MPNDTVTQWLITVVLVPVVGVLLKTIQALYDRLLTAAIEPRDERIASQKDQIEKLTVAFDKLADSIEKALPPGKGA